MSLREQTGPDGHQEIARHVGGRKVLLFATLRAITRAFRENRINEHQKYELKDMVIDHRAQEAKEWLTNHASQSFNPNFLDRDWFGPEPTPPSFSVLSWNLQAAKTRKAAPGEIGKDGRQQEKHDAFDRSYLELALRAIHDEHQQRVLGLPQGHHPDLIFFQELQTKVDNHAKWVDSEMTRKGYDGYYHPGHQHTVGLYWRTDLFRPVGNCTFEQFHTRKPCILQVLKHIRTGKTVLAVAVHLSVPHDRTGNFDEARGLREIDQMHGYIEDIYGSFTRSTNTRTVGGG